jgi:hypothetical protein
MGDRGWCGMVLRCPRSSTLRSSHSTADRGNLGLATAHKILDLFDEVAVCTPPAAGVPSCADNV